MGTPVHQDVVSLRFHRAKQLLLSTDLSVRDVAFEIGQQSLGTFATQFTAKVRVSPARFRHSEAQAVSQLRSLLSVDLSHLCSTLLAQRESQPLTGAVQPDESFVGTNNPELAEIHGERGAIVGITDEKSGPFEYGVFIFRDEMCWQLSEEDLEATGEHSTREDLYGDTVMRVQVDEQDRGNIVD